LNAKVEPSPVLSAEFFRVLRTEPAAAIEWAFRQWRDESDFFPTIHEVKELVATWHRAKADKDRARLEHEERERVKAAREKGELIDFATIKDLCAKISAHAGTPVPQPEEMVKPVYVPPPPQELKRRKEAQLKAVKEKYGK
jgi:hypothetical protein